MRTFFYCTDWLSSDFTSVLHFGVQLSSQCKFMLGAFHSVRMHLGGLVGVKPPIHFHCVLHAKRGWVGPDSM